MNSFYALRITWNFVDQNSGFFCTLKIQVSTSACIVSVVILFHPRVMSKADKSYTAVYYMCSKQTTETKTISSTVTSTMTHLSGKSHGRIMSSIDIADDISVGMEENPKVVKYPKTKKLLDNSSVTSRGFILATET